MGKTNLLKWFTCIAISLGLVTTGCKKTTVKSEKSYSIRVINQSQDSIRVLLCGPNATIHYPDTMLPSAIPVMQKLLSGDTTWYDSQNPWKDQIARLPVDTLSVFFIKDSVYSHVPWDSIRLHNMILQRSDFSIQQLDSLRYNIIYQ